MAMFLCTDWLSVANKELGDYDQFTTLLTQCGEFKHTSLAVSSKQLDVFHTEINIWKLKLNQKQIWLTWQFLYGFATTHLAVHTVIL